MKYQVNVAEVKQVYSGKDGKCCCGCSGKHSYASVFKKELTKSHGYDIDSGINDRTVKLIVGKINKLIGEGVTPEIHPSYVSIVNENGRLYIAYFVTGYER